jgi:collagen type VII alpha
VSYTKKIKAGLVLIDPNEFIGDKGTIFYDYETGVMALSDGITPGGTPLASGNGSRGYTGSAGSGYTGSTGLGYTGSTGVGYTGSAGLGIGDFGRGFTNTLDSGKITTSKLYNENPNPGLNNQYTLEVTNGGVVALPDGSIINGATLKTVPGNYAGITAGPASPAGRDEDSWVWVDNDGATIATKYSTSNFQWKFDNNGATTFPTLTVPISDNATPNGTGQTLKFSDSSQQAIIFGPVSTGSSPSARRIIIQGAPGFTGTAGEGGDVYLWAGPGGSLNGDGGDIKVRAGQGRGTGEGGYLNFQAGDSATGDGGWIRIESGESDNYGNGGDITVQARSGGEIYLRTLNSNGSTNEWLFGNNGDLHIAAGGTIRDPVTGDDLLNVGVSRRDTAPTANNGTLWFNTQEGRLYIKYSDQWVDAAPLIMPVPDTDIDVVSITFADASVQTTAFTGVAATGYTGSVGNIGYTGSVGNIGYTGSVGNIGYTGSVGNIGYTGSSGGTGNTLVNGSYIVSLAADGNLILPAGSTLGETANATVISPPGATSGQSLVIRPTNTWSLTSDHPSGFAPGDSITITFAPNAGNYVFGNAAYTFTDCTEEQLGRSLTGSLAYQEDQQQALTWTIPSLSDITSFTFTVENIVFPGSADPFITLTRNGSVSNEPGHLHLVAGNPTTVDLYLGDDNQYVKIEKNGGNVVVGTNTNTNHWTFGSNGNLTLPAGGDILDSTGTSVLGAVGYTGSFGNIGYTGSFGNIGYTGSVGETGYTGLFSETPAGATTVTLNQLTDITAWTGTLVFTKQNATTYQALPDGPSMAFTSPNWILGYDSTLWFSSTDLVTWVDGAYAGTTPPTGTLSAATVGLIVDSKTWTFSDSGNLTLPASGTINNSGGTAYKVAPTYGSFYSNITQTNTSLGNAIPISYNITDISNSVSITGAGATEIRIATTGVYNIQFSLQVSKTDGGADSVYVWLDKNGTRVENSATNLYLVGSNAAQVAAWNFVVNAAANDYYRLMWMSADSHVEIVAVTAGAVVPAIPSVILTVVPVGT